MAVANLIRMVLHWSGYGEEGTTGFYMAGAGAETAAALHAALVEANNRLSNDETPSAWANLETLITNQQRFDRYACYQYAADDGPATAQAEISLNLPGTTSQPCAGLQQSIVATTLTGQPGRRHRGRMYLPGHNKLVAVPDAQLSQAQCDQVAGYAGVLIETTVAAFQSSLGSNAIAAVVYSRASRSTLPMLSLRVDSRVDSQRRRAASQTPLRSGTANIAQT